MHIFREPESWNVSTGTSRSPGPEHAWYKWLNGSMNSETWFPKDKIHAIQISGMIKWKRSYGRSGNEFCVEEGPNPIFDPLPRNEKLCGNL